jgi:hypothetical protein
VRRSPQGLEPILVLTAAERILIPYQVMVQRVLEHNLNPETSVTIAPLMVVTPTVNALGILCKV